MLLFNDGNTALGSGTLDNSGKATFTTTMLTVGTHAITAVYGGDSADSGSTSAALQEVVHAASAVADMGAPPADLAGSAPADLGTAGGAPDLGRSPGGKGGGCGCTLTGSSAFEMTPFVLLGVLLLVLRAWRRRSS
jgi:hypothetical protein